MREVQGILHFTDVKEKRNIEKERKIHRFLWGGGGFKLMEI